MGVESHDNKSQFTVNTAEINTQFSPYIENSRSISTRQIVDATQCSTDNRCKYIPYIQFPLIKKS